MSPAHRKEHRQMEIIGFPGSVRAARRTSWGTRCFGDAVNRDADQAKSDLSSTLLAMAGHDLRQPLQVITSAHDVLARTTTTDRVEGLHAGCDDYLAKPYSFSELLARLEALGCRSDRSRRQAVLRVRDLELDTELRTVSRAGRVIELQRREYLLLEQLLRHAGQVLTRSMLLEAAWTYDFEARGHIVDMHIHRLRHKIDDGFDCRLIHTVTGAGYTVRALNAATP